MLGDMGVTGSQCYQTLIVVFVATSCPTLCNSTDCSCQALLSMGFPRQGYWMEWVTISFSNQTPYALFEN